MPIIERLEALEILDSRGRPTLQVICRLASGASARAQVPSGASTGQSEAVELRDGDPQRHGGMGCRRAVANVGGAIAGAICGATFDSQNSLDQTLCELDGTLNKSRLGANAILGVSLAYARAAAVENGVPLYKHFADMLDRSTVTLPIGAGTKPATRSQAPAWDQDVLEAPASATCRQEPAKQCVPRREPGNELRNAVDRSPVTLPMMTINLFSGGKHAGGQVPIQDVLIVPVGATTIDEGLASACAVVQTATELVEEQYGMRRLTADEGGLAPPFLSAEAMFEDALVAIERAGFQPGHDVALAVDVASSHFYQDGKYYLDKNPFSSDSMIDQVCRWVDRYPILSVEDGLAEDDWQHWPTLRARLAGRALTLGDDLLCTNPDRIRRAVDAGACDALLLKVNQIGTLTEAAEALRLARAAGWQVTISARSGETEDDWLADLAVGWGSDQIKVGSVRQSDRLAKYNRLLAIEAETRLPLDRWPS